MMSSSLADSPMFPSPDASTCGTAAAFGPPWTSDDSTPKSVKYPRSSARYQADHSMSGSQLNTVATDPSAAVLPPVVPAVVAPVVPAVVPASVVAASSLSEPQAARIADDDRNVESAENARRLDEASACVHGGGSSPICSWRMFVAVVAHALRPTARGLLVRPCRRARRWRPTARRRRSPHRTLGAGRAAGTSRRTRHRGPAARSGSRRRRRR